jgi:hypothetical protein
MKQKFLMTTIGAIACLWLASAQAAAPNPQFLGTWELDLSKTQPQPPAGDPKMMPKSITVNVKDLGGGKWTSEMVIEMADGTKQTQPSTPVSIDGTPTAIPNSPIVVTLTFPDKNTGVVNAVRDGTTVSTETYKLSADGKQMVHTTDAIGPDGNQVHMVQILNKK